MRLKFIFGQTVLYNGEKRKIMGIKFASNGVLYRVSRLNKWIREDELEEWSYKGKNIRN